MDTPRLLSEYFAARAQSATEISLDAMADRAIRSQTSSWLALRILKTTSHLYSAVIVIQPPFDRGPPV